MPADLTPSLRAEALAEWFADSIYANLPPDLALAAGYAAAQALRARLAVPPAALLPEPGERQVEWEDCDQPPRIARAERVLARLAAKEEGR